METPFVIVIDTREQQPFDFAGLRADAHEGRKPLSVARRRGGLPSGDYSVDGHIDRIAVERKSLNDLYHSLGQGRRRFKREIVRLSIMRYAAVVIEADWLTILGRPPEFSRLAPKVVYRTILAWQMQYSSVHWWACPSRRLAEITTFRILERYWRCHRNPDVCAVSPPESQIGDYASVVAERGHLRGVVQSLADRVAAQSELLTKAAERPAVF